MSSQRFGPFRIGSRSAAICIKGVVYYLYYARPCDHRLVSPADAGTIPWELLTSIATSLVKTEAGMRKQLSMHFSAVLSFADHALLSNHIILKLSTRRRTMIGFCARRRLRLLKELSDSEASTD